SERYASTCCPGQKKVAFTFARASVLRMEPQALLELQSSKVSAILRPTPSKCAHTLGRAARTTRNDFAEDAPTFPASSTPERLSLYVLAASRASWDGHRRSILPGASRRPRLGTSLRPAWSTRPTFTSTGVASYRRKRMRSGPCVSTVGLTPP